MKILLRLFNFNILQCACVRNFHSVCIVANWRIDTINKNDENHKAYKQQRNRCVKLLRNAKNSYFRDIDLNTLTDNSKFWKTIKPVFAEKIQTAPSITLQENEELINDDRKFAELFNNYFLNVTQDLGIQEDFAHISITNGINDQSIKPLRDIKTTQIS